MKILHVNDVAMVGTLLVRAAEGRDALYQPALRRDVGDGRLAGGRLALRRAQDVGRLRRVFRAGGFTHLHIHYATFAYLAEIARCPFSLHIHGGDVLVDMKHPLKRRLVIRALRTAHRVAVSTPDLLAPTRSMRPDAVYVPNPMEVPTAGRPWIELRRPRVVVLSKMDRLKGWPEQLLLLEGLLHRLPETEVSFFTHGQLPEQERERLTKKLLALGGQVVPALSHDAFLVHLASHHFALGQLEAGSLGMSEMEAMALGIPTIARVTAHVAAGFHPPVIDPRDAVTTLAAIWEAGREGSERWGLKCREYVTTHHAPSRSLRALESLLTSSAGGA